MKKSWIVILCLIVASLAACGTTNYDKSDLGTNTLDVGERNKQVDNDQFGFVRQVKTTSPNQNNKRVPIQTIDKEETADKISKIAVSLPNVKDISVLVTDQEVLIAYEVSDDEEKARFETADQVKQTAIAIVPRWYHVYLTDDPALKQDVKNIASMTAVTNDKDRTVKKTVKLMLERSPQGKNLNEEENANGETFDQMNQNLEKTNYHQQNQKENRR
ncbi:YhcN/YlaJ family sporulation lipoprotein [Lederbergia lenta]|uniref:YhcN/YlaJ family sporulation lipoprotein n=1 Tax=Lederbergia lenta TaxID=1467 RepID=UPI0020423715|nr:YhcN/YlaJ family sporulation lipoprotein [Lederbergia lenta]MCM3112953.1 YhcN/YlaJ family sporulation lipoprotein [Lederbergia lenta]